LVKPEISQLKPAVVHVNEPVVEETTYVVTAPALTTGGSQEIVTLPSPRVAVTDKGAEGI
jgi:hypothetical protein